MPADVTIQHRLGRGGDDRGAGDGSVLGRLGLLGDGLGLGLLNGLGLLGRLRGLLGGTLSRLVLGLVGGLLSSLALVLFVRLAYTPFCVGAGPVIRHLP